MPYNTNESAVAPSPVVPTYRPDPPPSSKTKRRQSSMASASKTGGSSPPSVGGLSQPQVSPPRPQARSAGMAERPSRNENLSDLVRFFQTTQNAPTPGPSSLQTPTSPDSTTALPVVTETAEPRKSEVELEKEVKPLHRRLLQFTQRQKKDPSSKSKVDENQRQIEALQREGYLLPTPKPKSTHSSKASISSKNSLERTFSKSKKQDVETIGQPWLENETKKGGPSEFKRRLASLDLGDFGSMVDVAVSLSTQFEETSPPPYQPPSSSGAASRTEQVGASYSSPALAMPSSSADSRLGTDGPLSPPTSTAATPGSVSHDEHGRQSSTSSSSMRIVDPDIKPLSVKTVSDRSLPSPSSSRSGGLQAEQAAEAVEQSVQASNRSTSSSSGSPPSQPSLKLFPDVAPPRMSSKHALRISSVPQYQRPPNPPSLVSTETQAQILDGESTPPKISPVPLQRSVNDEVRSCSGSSLSKDSAPPGLTHGHVDSQTKVKSRPPSLAMGTLKAFPLPAPTRPLPSIPRPGRAPPAVPDAKADTAPRAARSTLKAPNIQTSHPSPIAEEPCEHIASDPNSGASQTSERPATSLGYVGEAEFEADHDSAKSIHTPERPKSTSPEYSTPGRRASSIRIPRMQDLPESPGADRNEGTPLADSPLLGQVCPVKAPGKQAAARKELQINSHADRNRLPFGLPSPPPTAALPTDPPAQPLPDLPHGSRNYTAPIPASFLTSKSKDAQFVGTHHRTSMISRSDSSWSSLRHESIPESSGPSRCESPLPSSDDEGFGPGAENTNPRRLAEKHSRRVHPPHHGYATMSSRPSQSHPRYPHPVRSQTPQGRTNRTLEKSAMSPQSAYSHSTHRSRESRSTHRTQPHESQMAHYLEDRVANLERQNQILQAALLAALNAGVKNPFEGLGDALLPPGYAHSSHSNPYQSRFNPRPESWVGSSHSSEHSGFDTPGSYREGRPHARHLGNMVEDTESGWMSDKSSLGNPRMTKHC